VTTNKTELLSKLQQISTYGGVDDCPERAMEGMRRALEKALFKSHIFVFTDADANDKELESEVTQLIQDKQVTITFFITKGCAPPINGEYEIYKRLAQVSSGLSFYLAEKDISTVLSVTKGILKIDNSVAVVNDFEKTAEESHWVTPNTTEFMITVTGLEAKVSFTDPDNKSVVVDPKVDLNNVKAYVLDNPKPGIWAIHAEVQGAGRLQVTQDDPLKFEVGFSVAPPKTIKETSVRPLKNIKNHLVVAPFNVPAGTSFTFATISSDTFNYRYKLREFVPGLLITEAFLPPNRFKVNIHCKVADQNLNDAKRLISSYIEPKLECKYFDNLNYEWKVQIGSKNYNLLGMWQL
jgi:hypothetical protein